MNKKLLIPLWIWKIMRLSFHQFLLCAILCGASYAHETSGQAVLEKKVSLDVRGVRFKKVLSMLGEQADVRFVYSSNSIDSQRKVTLKAFNQRLDLVLKELLNPYSIEFTVSDGKMISLTPVPPATEGSIAVPELREEKLAREIRGRVVGENGEALPGVSILLKGTQQGTTTDTEGTFSLAVPNDEAVLVFSFVGYISQETVVGNRTSIDIYLEVDEKALGEIVVVGYGMKEKKHLTGAVSEVKGEDILGSRPLSNISSALQGAIPGLQITSGSGRPGQAASINIRGTTSINGGSPLVLVDNVPMSIDDVNPADIETVTVLKDAASSSIYGGRAAFGVILITTKKAARNQPIKFNYSNNFVVSQPSELPVKATTDELVKLFKDAGNTRYPTGQDLDTWSTLLDEYQKDPLKYPNGETHINGVKYRLAEDDLYRKFMTKGFEQIHNLSFSGGSEKADYRVSFGYANEDGVMITNKDRYRRFNVNAYLRTELVRGLTSTTNILYKNDDRLTPNNYSLLFRQGMSAGRHINSGHYIGDDGKTIPYDTPNNILKREPADQDLTEDLRIFKKLEYNILKGLKLTGEYTFRRSNTNSIITTTENIYYDFVSEAPTPITIRGSRSSSSYTRSHGTSYSNALNLYANYEKRYANSEFKILGGTNVEQNKYSYFTAERLNLLSVTTPSLATASGLMTNNESFSDYSVLGYFLRLDYSYKDRYLIEVNGRYDGSSRFPKNHRYGFFPSLSAGWLLSNEPFMKSLSEHAFIKIRGSWGEIGNQSISNYAYIPGMSTALASWVVQSTGIRPLTVLPPALVSSSFSWETVRTQNIGIDLSFLNQRLDATFDYFNRKTLDMLGPGSELPAVLGASAPTKNIADLVSKGWELSLNWKDKRKDFSYSLGLNLSDNRAFITEYDNKGGLLSQHYVGKEFGEIWGYETYGYYTPDDFETGTLNANLMNGTLKNGVPKFHTIALPNPGDTRYVDLNNDGKIDPGTNTLTNPGDQRIIGNSTRRYQFGMTGNASYKNFDLFIFIQGVGKRDVWNNSVLFFPYVGQYEGLYKHQLDYWTPENNKGFYPRNYPASSGNTSNGRLPQTKYLSNGAYLRIKNLGLGYTVPKINSKNSPLERVRIFVSIENLLKLDHLPNGIDTEADMVNSGGQYPHLRKYSAGLNISF